MESGIYCIKNLVNNKVYIGSAIYLKQRFGQHKSRLNRNENMPNKHLQSSWNKYGGGSFEFIVLEYIENLEKLKSIEDLYIDEFNSMDPRYGYNKKDAKHQLGLKHTRESKNKMSKSRIGKKHSEETKQKIGNSNKGKHNYTKENHPRYGKKQSKETKEKISKHRIENNLALGENNHQAKLNEFQVRIIKRLLEDGSWVYREIAEIFGISISVISAIKNRRNWKHI